MTRTSPAATEVPATAAGGQPPPGASRSRHSPALPRSRPGRPSTLPAGLLLALLLLLLALLLVLLAA